jgi:hypothetical protein
MGEIAREHLVFPACPQDHRRHGTAWLAETFGEPTRHVHKEASP